MPRKAKSAEIILNSNFYDEATVRQALDDFKGVFSGNASRKGKGINVSISKIHGDPEIAKHEFCNYVLALMKNRNLI
jgi:hypothetical protein